MQLIPFVVGSQLFAFPLQSVVEVARMVAITKLPDADPDLEGVIDVRGDLVPVADLRKRFGAGSAEDVGGRMLIVSDGHRLTALVVDDVLGVLEAPELEQSPRHAERTSGIARMDDSLVVVLDVGEYISNIRPSASA